MAHGFCTVSRSLALGQGLGKDMQVATVTISIGRNVGDEPMSDGEWVAFCSDIWQALYDADATVYVDEAKSVGEWDGIREESRTWVASVDDSVIDWIRISLAEFCRTYRQDAIALTVGVTELVGA